MAVYRVYVEKSPEYAVEAQGLLKEIRHILLIKSVTGVRVLNRYDVEGIEQALFDRCMPVVFSEPPVDVTYDRLPEGADAVIAVEYLPGQFDARAASCEECIQLVSQGERPTVRTARVYLFTGAPTPEELDRIRRREDRLFRESGGGSALKTGLREKIESKIPEKLMETMDAAFYTAFQVIFKRGTGLLGKTIPEKRLRADRYIKEYYLGKDPDARSVRAFHKSAVLSGAATTAMATAEGCALGLAGMGLPDIPILMSILLRAVYQTAVRYGFAYDTPQERYYILLLLSAALTRGPERAAFSRRADDFGRSVDHGEGPWFDLDTQMRETSKKALSNAMLVVKFIQGTAIVGVVGGACNFSASRKVTEVANLKYQKRFLEKKRRGL